MAKSNLVNLDALIKREDFGVTSGNEEASESFNTISLKDLVKGALVGPNLRKPDFQRETNHWTPQQVLSLLQSFVSGDLVPSVILWKSPTYLFVIDGGHRLSALRAWVEDDYGDGSLSYDFFGRDISPEQKKIADKTRKLINNTIGKYQQLEFDNNKEDLPLEERRRVSKIISRGLQVQWVKGDADKAQESFFKINTQGTPLDEVEELLLRNRSKPIPICARAIIRAGTGHKYWSSFGEEVSVQIENLSREFHKTLFEPEIKRPIKTLDLPLGGSKGVRTALQILIEFLQITNQGQSTPQKEVQDYEDDKDGSATLQVLKRSLKLARRISGNDSGSLGLHPAVYFYGPSGRHSRAMFLGVVDLLTAKVASNDKEFFKKFTRCRQNLEKILVQRKDLVATILQKHISRKRIQVFSSLLDELIRMLNAGLIVDDDAIVEISQLKGKIVLGHYVQTGQSFTEEAKSKSFLTVALESALKCPICKGYIDPEKSMSYDHVVRRREQGRGDAENCQMTHPYCNQSAKN